MADLNTPNKPKACPNKETEPGTDQPKLSWTDKIVATLNSKLKLATEAAAHYKNRSTEAEAALRLLYSSGKLTEFDEPAMAAKCYRRAAEVVGKGYSQSEMNTTIYRHINHVIEEVELLSKGDVVKQLQLAERVFKSLRGVSKTAYEQRTDRVQNAIMAGLKMWHHTMSLKHNGRFSNVNRAAQQAVQSAIAAGLQEGDFAQAERLTGQDRKKLKAARDRHSRTAPAAPTAH